MSKNLKTKNPKFLVSGFDYLLSYSYSYYETNRSDKPKPMVLIIHNVLFTTFRFRFIFRLVVLIVVYIKKFLSLLTYFKFVVQRYNKVFKSQVFFYLFFYLRLYFHEDLRIFFIIVDLGFRRLDYKYSIFFLISKFFYKKYTKLIKQSTIGNRNK